VGHGILREQPFPRIQCCFQKEKWSCETNRRKITLFRAPVSYDGGEGRRRKR
jgi:hypothetical protein